MKTPEEYRPKRKRVRPVIPKSKPRVIPRALRFPVRPELLDTDLIKPEYLTGGFCGCGHRQPDGVCLHCLGEELSDEG